jgi:hypothetical protein
MRGWLVIVLAALIAIWPTTCVLSHDTKPPPLPVPAPAALPADRGGALHAFLTEAMEDGGDRGPFAYPRSGGAESEGERAGDYTQPCDRLLRRFDQDRDLRLEEGERASAIEHLHRRLRARLDADGDGQLDVAAAQLQAALATFGAPFPSEPRTLLLRFDANEDWKLGLDEHEAIAQATRRHIAEIHAIGGPLLDLFDGDGDGALSEKERQVMIRRLTVGQESRPDAQAAGQ